MNAVKFVSLALIAGSVGTSFFKAVQDRALAIAAVRDAAHARAVVAAQAEKADEAKARVDELKKVSSKGLEDASPLVRNLDEISGLLRETSAIGRAFTRRP